MPFFRRFSSLLLPLAIVAFGSSCADEEDGFGGGPEGGGAVGGQPEGGGGSSPTTGGMGGTNEGGQPNGGSSTGGAPVGGGEEGGSGGEGGGSGLDPDLFPFETEDNGSLGSSNGLPDGAVGFQAKISDVNDVDVFSVFVPIGSTFRAAVTDGMGGCPPGAEVTVDVYSPANLQITNLTGLCPVVDGTTDPDLVTIDQEGTYFVRVTSAVTVPFYVLEIEVNPPVCGDGITQLGEECDDGNLDPADGCEPDCTQTPVCGDGTVQTGEACDDGNVVAGDGCDTMCQLEGDYCPEVEPNNTLPTATPITTCEGGYGEITSIGDQDNFRVAVTVPGSSIRAQVVDISGTSCPPGFASMLRLYNSVGQELGTDTIGGDASCSFIDPVTDIWTQNLPVGNYVIGVEDNGNNAVSAPYVVLIDVLPPGCGDGVYQPGAEECDDGNLADGDGCSAACLIEGNFCGELEPNDTIATASSVAGCDGAFGAIQPVGDKDYFAVEVTVPFSSIRAETTGPNPLTCAGMTTMLRLYNSAGTQLGTDTNGGIDSCSLINPAIDNWTRNLEVGTYYVSVEENGNNLPTPAWLLHLDVIAPGCGDGVTQPTEDCDDGNLNDGDGCTALCTVEGNYCAESRPNDSYTEATLIDACDGGSGTINYVSDIDWFEFEVLVPGSSARIEVTDLVGTGCPTDFNSFIRLFNSNANGTLGAQLGTDDNDAAGTGSCSLIDPLKPADSFAANLPAGTYYVRVEEGGNDATGGPYALQIDVTPPGCGDSLLQAGEECDDGNTGDFDGCSATCLIEGNFCGEIEPNDSIATASSIAGCDGGFGANTDPADLDYFAVEVTVPGSSIRAEVTAPNPTQCGTDHDTTLRLFNGAGAELGNDAADGIDSCGWINPTTDAWASDLPVGTYFVRVEESGLNAATGTWLLHVDVLPPICGDGVMQAGEECDDSNAASGDGCSSTCQIDYCDEVEPNDSTATATSLSGCFGGTGAVTPVGDKDYFSFEVTVPGSSVRLETIGLLGGLCTGMGTAIRLYNSGGVELGSDTIDGVGSCSLINPVNDVFARSLAVGTYFVSVEDNSNNAVTPPWLLHVQVNPPGCDDGVLDAAEDCDDGDSSSTEICPSTCTYSQITCAPSETFVQLDATGLPAPIADLTSVLSTIAGPNVGTVTQAALIVDITHEANLDLDLFLQSPNGTSVELSTDNGSTNDNYLNTYFRSDANVVVSDIAGRQLSPFNGMFAPEGSLTAFNGGPSDGNWVFTATDDGANDIGSLSSVTLMLCVQP